MKSPVVCLLALCVGAASVHAQNAAPPFVFGGPPAAIVPVPFEEKPGVQLRWRSTDTFSVHLINVKPSLMAYWLDPQHHLGPFIPFAQSHATTRFVLPFGVERIEADDKTNTLLIHGTGKAAQELSDTIAFLDRPQYLLQFDCVAFWVDSLAPEATKWSKPSLGFQNADAAQVAELESLADTDRAARLGLQVPGLQAGGSVSLSLPFAVQSEKPPVDSQTPFPPFGPNKDFEDQMPGSNNKVPIDPEMPNGFQNSSPVVDPTSLQLTPSAHGDYTIVRAQTGARTLFGLARLEESLLLFGSAKAFGLVPPSPRFGALVVKITPTPVRVVNGVPRPIYRFSNP